MYMYNHRDSAVCTEVSNGVVTNRYYSAIRDKQQTCASTGNFLKKERKMLTKYMTQVFVKFNPFGKEGMFLDLY